MAAENAPSIKETMLASNIQQSPAVRQRIEAIVRDKLWDMTDVDPTITLPIDDLAWAVASDDKVRKACRDALDSEQPNISRGVEAISDAVLYTAVTNAMKRLKIGEAPA